MFSLGLSEIVLIVADVPKSAAFYRDVVGLEPFTEPSDDWAWFWTGQPQESAWLALHKGTLLFEEHSPHPKGQRWGQVHLALRVPRETLMKAADHVRSKGVNVFGPTHFDWMNAESYYFYDLDGNLVEWWSPDPQ